MKHQITLSQRSKVDSQPHNQPTTIQSNKVTRVHRLYLGRVRLVAALSMVANTAKIHIIEGGSSTKTGPTFMNLMLSATKFSPSNI